jgi:hypothetical protein
MPRFEAKWLQEEGCEEVVKNSWTLKMQVENHGVVGALKGVLSDMVDWSKNVLGDLDKRIRKLERSWKCGERRVLVMNRSKK